MSYHIAAIVFAYFIDLIVGDPLNWPHPVKWFGKMIRFFDVHWNKGLNRKYKGTIMVVLLVVIVFSISFGMVSFFYHVHPLVGMIIEAVLISTTIAQKSLEEAAMEVVRPLQANRLQEARKKLSYIVGRDTENLSVQEIVRGTVETVAENISDGITAPLFWSLIGGAPFALVYRVINTCDSMVGYRNEKYEAFGLTSAKFDDVLNWLPSRITAFVMMQVMKPKKVTTKMAWSILLRDARKHPSPNSGWGEAAVASLLGIQLGGINIYNGRKSFRALMGDPLDRLQMKHILETITIMKRTVFIFLLLMVLGGITIELAFAWI
ncbi:adenosylcobinamide-phosphate synthase CbiB [Neobacillus sp. PS3-40]|uniref:adenosylcobinamide-phosphate synthase CbiB n=1 Tax=Neobacillus sp. PS3-40 TaxID=3070679 RepID=UPI0027DFAF66|nr:adenosylcobinamide-phosphate synthase CbiB [Neobacillus sp. PS3-40]WML43030.1 adenosylcobinamide-phosphate synthase CbiB [Neobacillus sp. PS3-40]